jgi:hypothetical protein
MKSDPIFAMVVTFTLAVIGMIVIYRALHP